MSVPSSKLTQQPTPTTFNERLNEQLINCLNVQTNVIQNLAQYSQHISLQLFEIKGIVEILSNRVLALQQQQQQQQQPHYPPSTYAASYYPNYMPQHTVPAPHQPPPPSHPPSVPFSVPPPSQHHPQQIPVQTRLPTASTAPPPANANFPFASSNINNPLYQQLQQPPQPSSSQASSTPMSLFPFSTSTSTQSSVTNTLPPTITTPTKTLFPNASKPTVSEPTSKPPTQTTTTTTTSSLFPTSTTNSSSEKPATGGLFSFGTGNTVPTFGTSNLPTSFGVGGGFANSLPNLSTPKQEANADENGDDDDEDDSYEPNVSFKPIVQLSAVEVKTGEEDENVLFCERGKLYRFDTAKNEMKERGLGEMKILQHKSTNVCRILMRREQVLKICANHQITPQIDLKPHSSAPNAFIWSAMDFADGEAKHETLCIRFKTDEQAKNFAKVFNEAKQKNVQKSGDTTTAAKTSTNNETKAKSNDNDDDVISIDEVKPSAEQIDRAKKLQLPSTFYLYENKDPCKGCVGCEEDTSTVTSNENKTTTSTTNKANEPSKTDSKVSAPQTPSTAAITKTPLSSSENIKFSFTNPDKSQTQLQKQTSTTKEEKPSAESPAPATPTQNETKSSIFGGFNQNSGTSIFGNATPLNNSTTVFGGGATLKPATGGTTGFSFPGFGNTSAAGTPSVGFQFSTPSAAPATSNTSSTFSFGTNNAATNNDKPLFGNTPKFSFADLAKQPSNDKPVSNGTDQRVFAGQGSLVFGTGVVNTSTTAGNNNDDDEGEGGGEDDSYEPNVSFKPIVQLSAVEVKTGEEDESVLFCERGKLYRFDTDTNQMKERGIGEMKILQHKSTNICRILMRREQVLKLCANHKITSQMDLKPHSGTENAFVWSAMDFSEGETKHETFCIRFKSSEIANRFLKQFNDAKQINANAQQ